MDMGKPGSGPRGGNHMVAGSTGNVLNWVQREKNQEV